jgi:cobalt-zinc-cadmium efflux system protein
MLPTTTPLLHDRHTSIHQRIIYYIRILLQEKHSRKLFIFTSILLLFSLIEVLFGLLYSASLSMLLAGFHSIQQTFGYVIVLTSSLVVAKKSPNFDYSYGYERLEVVLNFSNSVLILFLCFAMITESVQRLVEPHEVKT